MIGLDDQYTLRITTEKVRSSKRLIVCHGTRPCPIRPQFHPAITQIKPLHAGLVNQTAYNPQSITMQLTERQRVSILWGLSQSSSEAAEQWPMPPLRERSLDHGPLVHGNNNINNRVHGGRRDRPISSAIRSLFMAGLIVVLILTSRALASSGHGPCRTSSAAQRLEHKSPLCGTFGLCMSFLIHRRPMALEAFEHINLDLKLQESTRLWTRVWS